MRRNPARFVLALGCGLLLALIGSAAAAGHHAPAVSVSPGSGGPHSIFRVRFRAPAAVGASPATSSSYWISASTQSRAGCQWSVTRRVSSAHKGEIEYVRLVAGNGSGGWCRGTFRGTVVLVRAPRCGPPIASAVLCPEFVDIAAQVGKFSFRVR